MVCLAEGRGESRAERTDDLRSPVCNDRGTAPFIRVLPRVCRAGTHTSNIFTSHHAITKCGLPFLLLRLLRPFGIITCHPERLPVTEVGRPRIVKL